MRVLRPFLTVFFIPALGFSQNSFSISGQLIDADTKQPVPFATVFLSNSAFGSTAKEDGTYFFDQIPPGKYELMVSEVGYQRFSHLVLFSDSSIKLNIALKQQITKLKEVIVTADRSDFNKWYPAFKKYFLGDMPNSNKCTILNPDVIDLQYDSEKKILKGYADLPIEIENKAIGYQIHYMLDEFEVVYTANSSSFKYYGIARFEELVPVNHAQMVIWRKRRDKAYYGSLSHFMKSLLQRELLKNEFGIFKPSKDGDWHKITEDSLFTKSKRNQINYKGRMGIEFYGQPEQSRVSGVYHSYQISTVRLEEDSITIYDNGYF